MPPKRPFGVTLFIWMVLSLSAWGAVRFSAALSWWDVLSQYRSSLSPVYLSITGVGWAVAGAVLLWKLWSGKPWARAAIPTAVTLWLVEYWTERIFFQTPRANLPFMIVFTVLLLILTFAIAIHAKTKNYFLKSEEHEQPETPTTSE